MSDRTRRPTRPPWPSPFRVFLFSVLLAAAAAPACPALESDGWRIGIQVGGTGLVSLLVEYHFSDNSICLNAGIFDSFLEPDIALWYRRYVRFAGLDGTGLAPYAGAGAAVLANVHDLSGAIVLAGAAAGMDWNFWRSLSLCGEADLLLMLKPWTHRPVFTPALSLRAGL